MSHYTKGRSFEYEIKKLFVDAGYNVTRAAGSHSLFDLIASRITKQQRKTVFAFCVMQCKVTKAKGIPQL